MPLTVMQTTGRASPGATQGLPEFTFALYLRVRHTGIAQFSPFLDPPERGIHPASTQANPQRWTLSTNVMNRKCNVNSRFIRHKFHHPSH